jgi:dynein heavy chain
VYVESTCVYAVRLQELIRPDILPGGRLDDPASWAAPALQLAPGFQAPLPSSFDGLTEYIETALPAESPVMYGMHPNAGVLLSTSLGETLFKTITEVSGGATGRLYVKAGVSELSEHPCRYQ